MGPLDLAEPLLVIPDDAAGLITAVETSFPLDNDGQHRTTGTGGSNGNLLGRQLGGPRRRSAEPPATLIGRGCEAGLRARYRDRMMESQWNTWFDATTSLRGAPYVSGNWSG